MIPSFEVYLRKYLSAVFFFILPVTAFFASSITRNVLNISLAELILSLGAITASLVFTVLRDSRGYWFYVIRSAKMFDSKKSRKRYLEEDVPWILRQFFQ